MLFFRRNNHNRNGINSISYSILYLLILASDEKISKDVRDNMVKFDKIKLFVKLIISIRLKTEVVNIFFLNVAGCMRRMHKDLKKISKNSHIYLPID